MPFKRQWDDNCPRIWDQWDDGIAKWTIQDLPPSDDDEAVQIMVDEFLVDEIVCKTCCITSDPLSLEASKQFWYKTASQRVSLACYREKDNKKELVALNMCAVLCADDPQNTEKFPIPWQTVMDCLTLPGTKCNPFKELGVDRYLSGAGLSVKRTARGAGLGAKLLKARDLLCRSIGIPATVTLFSGPASQRSAATAGFHVITEISFAECADAGIKLPRDETVIMKFMAKKFV